MMKKTAVVFEYTRTVRHCLGDIVSHLQPVGEDPQRILRQVIEQFEERVAAFPSGCQILPELLKLGCAKYREFNTLNGYRVLYSINDMTITVYAILAQRQDIKQLLFKRLMMV